MAASKRPTGTPAAAILAGGITRHGPSCSCHYCARPVIEVVRGNVRSHERQAIPVQPDPPVYGTPDDIRTIDQQRDLNARAFGADWLEGSCSSCGTTFDAERLDDKKRCAGCRPVLVEMTTNDAMIVGTTLRMLAREQVPGGDASVRMGAVGEAMVAATRKARS